MPTPSPEEVYLKGLQGQGPPPPPEQGTRSISKRSFLAHHDAHPFALDVLLLKTFGPQYYSWEARTIWMELRRLFSTTISELNQNKIEAVRTLHLSDSPWKRWETFEKVCQALNNNIPRFDIMQKCSISQLWNAARIMKMVRGERFTGDVPRYAAAVFMHDGVDWAPEPLSFIKPHLDERMDVREAFLTHTPDKELGENEVDIQVARLLVAKNYVGMRDSQLHEQLKMLKEAAPL